MTPRAALILAAATLIAIPALASTPGEAIDDPRVHEGDVSHDPSTPPEDGLGVIDARDPEDVRRVLLVWAETMEAAHGVAPVASRKIAALDAEQMEYFHSIVSDPEHWVGSMRAVIADLTSLQPPVVPHAVPPPTSASYPPNSGPYRTFVQPLFDAGYISSTSFRCNEVTFASAYSAWFTANEALSIAEVACVIGGCDPTGVACAVACAVVETVRAAFNLATIPVRLCEFHDGNVADSELQAIYINTQSTFVGQQSLEDSIESEGSSIRSNDDANRASLASDIASARAALLARDDSNAAATQANDDANAAAIQGNDDANKDALASDIASARAAILARDDANAGATQANDDANAAAIQGNDDANTTTILDALDVTRTEILTNDDANAATTIGAIASTEATLIAEGDAHLATLLADGLAHRDAVIANADAHAAAILDRLDAVVTGTLVREIQNMLGAGQCEPWMVLPNAAPHGQLELVIEVVDDVIDGSEAFGTASAGHVAQARARLDAVRASLAAAPPIDAQRTCTDLLQAYGRVSVGGPR